MSRETPIRTDSSNAFAHFSMHVRVPAILDEVLARNPDYSAAIRGRVAALRDAIRNNAPLPPLALPAPDAEAWAAALAERRAESWLNTEWFFAECYLYRQLLSATRYWETGRDPFAPAKLEELNSERLWESVQNGLELDQEPRERFHQLLGLALWSNRVDLSYRTGTSFGRQGAHSDILVDDRAWATNRLLAARDVHLLADNAGSELAADLLLIDALLAEPETRLTLHLKAHPTFVSDALVTDIWLMFEALARGKPAMQALAHRLNHGFELGRLRLAPDAYWNGPAFLRDRPARLAALLDSAELVILKGDANYRRLVGDVNFAPGTSLQSAAGYFPAPLLCIRTLKSDSITGISTETAAALSQTEPAWRVNGRYGIIQGSTWLGAGGLRSG